PNRGNGGPVKGPRFCASVPQKRHAPGGDPFLPAAQVRNPSPLAPLALSRFLRRATVGACKNRSAAPAAPSLLRPLDALGAAARAKAKAAARLPEGAHSGFRSAKG